MNRWLMACVMTVSLSSLGIPVGAQSRSSLSINADTQEANAKTGVIVAVGNVRISYPAQALTASAQKATYYTKEQRIVLEGKVSITQQQNQLQAETITYLINQGTIQAKPSNGQQVQTIYVFPEETTP